MSIPVAMIAKRAHAVAIATPREREGELSVIRLYTRRIEGPLEQSENYGILFGKIFLFGGGDYFF